MPEQEGALGREDCIAQAVMTLSRAHDDGMQVPDLAQPYRLPDLAAAKEVQLRVVRGLGPIGGWKVSAAGQGSALMSAPIPARLLGRSGDAVSVSPFRDVYMEVEIAFILGPAISLRSVGDEHPIRDCVQECRVAMEIVHSRFSAELAQLPSEHFQADLGGCAALLAGDVISMDVLRKPETVETLMILPNGERVHRSGYGHDPFALLDALARECRQRDEPLQPGQLVTTGALAYAAGIPGTCSASIAGAAVTVTLV